MNILIMIQQEKIDFSDVGKLFCFNIFARTIGWTKELEKAANYSAHCCNDSKSLPTCYMLVCYYYNAINVQFTSH